MLCLKHNNLEVLALLIPRATSHGTVPQREAKFRVDDLAAPPGIWELPCVVDILDPAHACDNVGDPSGRGGVRHGDEAPGPRTYAGVAVERTDAAAPTQHRSSSEGYQCT